MTLRLAAAFYKAGVRHIVYTGKAVSDASASRFAKSFYLALACKRSLKNAFSIALAEVQATLPEGFDSGFKLHSADDVIMEVKSSETSSKWQAILAAALPGQVEDFVGREETMLTVLQHLAQRRVVVLHCQRSLGLTATLVEIARYVSAPGRKFSGRCIFGTVQVLQRGLLILDNADLLLPFHKHVLRKNLQSPDFFLLLGCRSPHWDLFQDIVKAVHVELPPLSDLEAATLFAQRCHRPLSLDDILPEGSEERKDMKEPLPKERARQLLKPMVSIFDGDPNLIRQAAGKVTPSRSALHGDLVQLAEFSPAQKSNAVSCYLGICGDFLGPIEHTNYI